MKELTSTPLPARYQFQGSGFQGNQRVGNVPHLTLMLAERKFWLAKMFNRGNLNNKNINGDSREM